MKTIKILGMTLIAAILGFTTVSCSDSDNAPIVLDDSIPPTTVDDALAIVSEVIAATDSKGVLSSISPASDCAIGKIVAGYGKAFIFKSGATRAINSDVIVCEYKVENGKLIINGGAEFGEIVVTTVDNAVSIAFQGMMLPGTKEDLAPAKSDSEISICRAWSNATYTAGIYVDKLPIYGAKPEEKVERSSIIELKDAIMNKLQKDNKMTDDGFKFLAHNIVGLEILTNGKLYISYDNGNVEESDWRWISEKDGKFTTTIDGKSVNVDVRYKAGDPNTAYFVIDANLEGVGNLGVHELSGRLVCRMTD